jgi:uncharacterized membrane protein YcaP (DUF421 family)
MAAMNSCAVFHISVFNLSGEGEPRRAGDACDANHGTRLRVGKTRFSEGASMSIDWNSVFVRTLSFAEIILRGSIMYLGLFAVLRFMGRRQAGNFGPADLLVIVLIADAAQNGMGKEYSSVTEGLVLVLTILGGEFLIDWLQYRFPALRSLLTTPPLTLIEDGRVDKANLHKELLTEDELRSQLREKEVLEYSEVKLAKLEGDGRLSVIKARS